MAQNVFLRRCVAEDVVLWTNAIAIVIGYGVVGDTFLVIVDENPDMIASIDIVATITRESKRKSNAVRPEDPTKSKLPELLLLFLLFVIDSMRNHTFGRSCRVRTV